MSDAPRSPNAASGADFLQRVVDRAFEHADALAPRLPSLFEPQSVSVVWPAEPGRREDEPPVADGIADRAAPGAERRALSIPAPLSRRQEAAASTPGREPDRRTPSDGIGLEASDDVPEGQAHDARERVQTSARVVAGALRTEHRWSPPVMDGRRLASAQRERGLQPPAAEPPSGELLAQKVPAVAPVDREPMAARVASLNASVTRSNERAPIAHDPRNAPEPPPRRIVVDAANARHRSEREPARIEPMPPVTEPVVNVTIGRVEIRAVAPPPRTRQSPQTPKPLSLDDYLKQRGGGR